MDPRHLIQLAVILDKGSITAAANHLRMTQPTLTRNIGTLEMQAGQQLFSRSRFGVRSTPMGEDLARQGRAIARQMELCRVVTSRHKSGLNAHLRIAAGPLIGMALIPRLVENVMNERPGLSISVTSGRPLTLLEQLADGDQDIAIAPAVYEQTPPGIARELLAADEISIFCAPTHPLVTVAKPTPNELNACEWMNVGATSPFQNTEIDMLARSGIQRARTQFATTGDAVILLQVLMKGKHLAVLPKLPMRLMQAQHPVVEIPPPSGTSRRDLYVWYRRDLQDDPNFQAVFKHSLAVIDAMTVGA